MRLFLLSIPLILLASCASQPEDPSKAAFLKADVDGDGLVSRSEATDFLIAEVFARFDTNGDGFVDQAEYLAAGGTVGQFKKLDRSGAGRLTLAAAQESPEAIEHMAVPFDEADVNNNGAISYEELLGYRARLDAQFR